MSLQNFQIACIRAIINTRLYITRSSWLSPATQPNHTKTYNDRHDLYPVRIFIPAENDKQKLPLVVNIHGGGFILNNPSADDELARYLADTSKCIVVSVDYRKAPQNKFPRAYEDVVEQILAIIEDPDLPVDRSRVVLCGSSAGGNLILAAAQDARLKGQKLAGAVSIYPLCDFIPSGKDKMASRPDPEIPDFLGDSYNNVAPLYLDPDEQVDLEDVRLSPTYFAARNDLPSNMLLLGAEHDLLCCEAADMADKLAAGTKKIDIEGGWQAGGVRWFKVSGQTHAFEHIPSKDPQKEKARTAAVVEMRSVISNWLTDLFSKTC